MRFSGTLLASIFLLFQFASGNKDLVLSDKERAALGKLRTLVQSENLPETWLKEDWSLLHYLRVKDLDVKKAVAAIKETVQWRETNKMQSIVQENIIDLKPAYTSKPTAKDSSPVMIWFPARWDIRKELVAGNRAKLVRYFDQMSEETHQRIRADQATGKNTTQWIQILDLYGYNLRQHGCVACFPVYYEWVAHWEKHYPGAHQKFFYINTPRIFQPLLELLKALYSKPTRDALVVLGVDKGEWLPELLKLIDPSELPKIIGGTNLG